MSGKTTIIGVNPGHNATAALMIGGRLVALESTERQNRLKNSVGWPVLLVEEYAALVGGFDAVTEIAVCGTDPMPLEALSQYGDEPRMMFGSLDGRKPLPREEARRRDQANQAARLAYDTPANRARLPGLFGEAYGISPGLLGFHDHQQCHAWSTLPFIPEEARGEKWLVLTLDGMGDGQCGSVSVWHEGQLTLLETVPDTRSLGLIYAYTTMLMGFRAYEHEYKIMGLAPYAKGAHWRPLMARFEEVLRVDPATGGWTGLDLGVNEREAVIGDIVAYQRFDNVAAALQAYVEAQVTAWVSHWIARTGIPRVACAGGFFMNVKANQKLAQLPALTQLVVVPSCGDESAAIGSAVKATLDHAPDSFIARVTGLYLGRSYERDEIEAAIRDSGADQRYRITEPADMAEAAADLLAAGEVVARCDGGMEFGARALGNRSILADPSRLDTVAFINQAIKSRDFWMPFAPSVLAERAADYFDIETPAQPEYMMVSYDSTPLARTQLIAATHQADKTLRPQMVRADWNPGYHRLISAFERRTGIGAVLNTSFNIHGEPIVGSPADAISTMDRSGLRHLILGPFLLQKIPE